MTAATFVCAAGFALAHAATDGFQAYTLESARRLQALRSPVALPDLALDLSDGSHARLSGIPGRVLLVDFIYTSCPTLCVALGSVYARLQQQLSAEIAAGDVRLVSVSFDPARDGAAELAAYRARFSSDARGWDLARPAQADDLRRWLGAFGVVVIPDALGGYTHNAAMHVVASGRRLVAILDPGDTAAIVKAVREHIAGDARNAPAP